MSTKTVKREKFQIGFESELYNNVRNEAVESVTPLNNAIEELESITKKPISDFKAFSQDILGYALREIKATFPKPFDLDLGDEATLKMLSIDLTKLKEYAKHWNVNTECTINDGFARVEVDRERFNVYCETDEQFERYDFCMQAIDTIEKAVKYATWLRPQDLASYYKYFVESSFDIDGKAKLSVRSQFVLTGN